MNRGELLIAITFNTQRGFCRKRRSFYFSRERILELVDGDVTALHDRALLEQVYRRLLRDGCSAREILFRLRSVFGAELMTELLR